MRQFSPAEERSARIVAAVKKVAEEVGRSAAQVALAWLQYRPVPVIPIIGARKLSQLEDNLASLELALSDDQVKALDEASQIEMGFPHDFFRRDMVRTFVYGGTRNLIDA